jgi:hypothetical protein
MSDLSEVEILSRHKAALGEAREACLFLARNADPFQAAPRGHHYRMLRAALRALEGSSRQMAHWREDARWLKLGIHYAKAQRVAHQLFLKMNWLGFQTFSTMFDNGLSHLDELATRKTGHMGMILPKNTDFLRMPEMVPYRPNGRLMH